MQKYYKNTTNVTFLNNKIVHVHDFSPDYCLVLDQVRPILKKNVLFYYEKNNAK